MHTQKLLKILSIIPVGSMEIERSFLFIRWTHNWLRNSMSADLLGDLAVNVMHGPPNSYFKNKYIYVHMSMHRQRMITFSLLIDAWFIRYLYILITTNSTIRLVLRPWSQKKDRNIDKLLLSFCIITFNMMKLLVVHFISKLFARINLLKKS